MQKKKETYTDLIKESYSFCGKGVTDYFMKEFHDNENDPAVLLNLIDNMDFSSPGKWKDITVAKKIEILKSSAERSSRSDSVLVPLGAMISTSAFAFAALISIIGNMKELVGAEGFASLLAISVLVVEIVAALFIVAIVIFFILDNRLKKKKNDYLDVLDYLENVLSQSGPNAEM